MRTSAYVVTLSLLLIIPAASRVAAATFDLVGIHPDAATQPTTTGRLLRTLTPFRGKLYVGYGDFNANTGPINVRYFDPVTDSFSDVKLTSLTEAIYTYREIDGKLYAPNQDTSAGGGGASGYAVGTPSGSSEVWQDRLDVPGVHMFDMNTFSGTDLFMSGALGTPGFEAVIWHSTDGGNSWQQSLTVAPPANPGYDRFWGLGRFDGKLWAQAEFSDPAGGANSQSWTYDGTSWSRGPNLFPVTGNGLSSGLYHPQQFGGHMVYMANGIGRSRLYKFDGVTAELTWTDPNPAADSLLFDFAIKGDTLYGLLTDGRVIQTQDLTHWAVLDTGSNASRSLAFIGDRLYLGGTDGQLWRYSNSVFRLGDMNGDDYVNNFDIQPFELALTDPAAYRALYPQLTNYALRADINGDGQFNNFDIQPFEQLLTGSVSASAVVPEPGSIVLLSIGAALLGLRWVSGRAKR